jgi:CTD small phosphatase-like protein 2
VFTAGEQSYANKVIDLLDPGHKLIKHRIYRNSCLALNSLFVKDLNVLERDLAKTLIVDNNPSAFAFNVRGKFKL